MERRQEKDILDSDIYGTLDELHEFGISDFTIRCRVWGFDANIGAVFAGLYSGAKIRRLGRC